MPKSKVGVLTCHHGRPLDGGDWIRDIVPCDDCRQEEWMHTRSATLIGLVILVVLIMTPALLILSGMLW